MASRETRARLAAAGAVYLCPRPQVQRAQGAFAAALEAIGSGDPPLSAVVREGPQGARELSAEGSASPVALRQPVGEPVPHGPARRVVGRSGRPAHAAEVALRARVAQALAQIEALNQRGRGKKWFETVAALRQAVVALIQRDGVDDLVWFRLPPPVTSRPVRASRAQPARVDHDQEATVEVCVDEAAVEATVRRVGWRV